MNDSDGSKVEVPKEEPKEIVNDDHKTKFKMFEHSCIIGFPQNLSEPKVKPTSTILQKPTPTKLFLRNTTPEPRTYYLKTSSSLPKLSEPNQNKSTTKPNFHIMTNKTHQNSPKQKIKSPLQSILLPSGPVEKYPNRQVALEKKIAMKKRAAADRAARRLEPGFVEGGFLGGAEESEESEVAPEYDGMVKMRRHSSMTLFNYRYRIDPLEADAGPPVLDQSELAKEKEKIELEKKKKLEKTPSMLGEGFFDSDFMVQTNDNVPPPLSPKKTCIPNKYFQAFEDELAKTVSFGKKFDDVKSKKYLNRQDIGYLLNYNKSQKQLVEKDFRAKSQEKEDLLKSHYRAFNSVVKKTEKRLKVTIPTRVMEEDDVVMSSDSNIVIVNATTTSVEQIQSEGKKYSGIPKSPKGGQSQKLAIAIPEPDELLGLFDKLSPPMLPYEVLRKATFGLAFKIEEKLMPSVKPDSRERAKSCINFDQSKNNLATIYMFGGVGMECIEDIVTYSRGNWNQLSTTDTGTLLARFDHTLAMFRGEFLVSFGGESNKGRPTTTKTNDLMVYTFKQQTWERRSWAGTYPTSRSGHTSIIINDYMIIFGGKDEEEEYLLDVHAANIGSIYQKGAINCRRISVLNETSLNGLAYHAMIYIGEQDDVTSDRAKANPIAKNKDMKYRNEAGVEYGLYIFGGIQSKDYKSSRELYMLKIHSPVFHLKKVETLGKRPRPRLGHTMHFIKKTQSIVVLHGRDTMTRGYLKSISILNMVNLHWHSVKIIGSIDPRPRGFHCSELDENTGKIFIFGGIADDGFVSHEMSVYWIEQFRLNLPIANSDKKSK